MALTEWSYTAELDDGSEEDRLVIYSFVKGCKGSWDYPEEPSYVEVVDVMATATGGDRLNDMKSAEVEALAQKIYESLISDRE